tara:strand:+ start:670 stop:897 length:228 start_codon:yes stop_codon:yes gene_type:complete
MSAIVERYLLFFKSSVSFTEDSLKSFLFFFLKNEKMQFLSIFSNKKSLLVQAMQVFQVQNYCTVPCELGTDIDGN